MKYWIASGNRENWNVVKEKNIWGVPKGSKGLHSRVNVSDHILIYVRSETHGHDVLPSAIMGDFTVTEIFEDSNVIFTAPSQMGDEVFPYRFRIKPVKVFKEPVEIKPLISELGFVTNKTQWSGHFRHAMREITEEDYKRIIKASNGNYINKSPFL